MQLGSVYIIVKDFYKSLKFYEYLLDMQVSSKNMDRFAQFQFGDKNISIMNGYFDSQLKKNGILIAGFGNPIEYIFDVGELDKGNLVVKHKIPYSDLEHLDDEAVVSICKEDGFIFGHTLTDQIQGQIDAGFAIVGFYEDTGGTALDQFIYSSIATKAIKL